MNATPTATSLPTAQNAQNVASYFAKRRMNIIASVTGWSFQGPAGAVERVPASAKAAVVAALQARVEHLRAGALPRLIHGYEHGSACPTCGEEYIGGGGDPCMLCTAALDHVHAVEQGYRPHAVRTLWKLAGVAKVPTWVRDELLPHARRLVALPPSQRPAWARLLLEAS